MRNIHPCCGYPSQLGAKFIAICDLIFGLVGIFWFIYILQSYGLLLESQQTPDLPHHVKNHTTPKFNDWFLSLHSNNESVNESVVYNKGSVFAITNSGIEIYKETANICLSGVYTLINLCLSVLLLSAANEQCICLLITWFVIRLFIILFKGVIYIVYIVIGASVSTQMPHIFFMIVHAYGLWIVWVFVKEIKTARDQLQSDSDSKPSKTIGMENKEFDNDEMEPEDAPPFDKPQKRKMTITIIEPDRVTIFEPYVGDGAGIEIKTENEPKDKDKECENKSHEEKVIKSILHKPTSSQCLNSQNNSHTYRNSY